MFARDYFQKNSKIQCSMMKRKKNKSGYKSYFMNIYRKHFNFPSHFREKSDTFKILFKKLIQNIRHTCYGKKQNFFKDVVE